MACPKTAVSLEFLEWLRVLQLERHIWTVGFCSAVPKKNQRASGYTAKVRALTILYNCLSFQRVISRF